MKFCYEGRVIQPGATYSAMLKGTLTVLGRNIVDLKTVHGIISHHQYLIEDYLNK